MMQIELNGQPTRIVAGSTLQQLLDTLDLGEKRVAVELNLEVVPRSSYGSLELQSGDQIEVVHAIGGG